MQNYEKFTVTVISFALFAIIAFVTCIVYYLVQKRKILTRNKNLPSNYRIDTNNLTPLNIVIVGSREFKNLT